ncbi:hypothetical protein NPIL_341521, partial [Nephila pilipes]
MLSSISTISSGPRSILLSKTLISIYISHQKFIQSLTLPLNTSTSKAMKTHVEVTTSTNRKYVFTLKGCAGFPSGQIGFSLPM